MRRCGVIRRSVLIPIVVSGVRCCNRGRTWSAPRTHLSRSRSRTRMQALIVRSVGSPWTTNETTNGARAQTHAHTHTHPRTLRGVKCASVSVYLCVSVCVCDRSVHAVRCAPHVGGIQSTRSAHQRASVPTTNSVRPQSSAHARSHGRTVANTHTHTWRQHARTSFTHSHPPYTTTRRAQSAKQNAAEHTTGGILFRIKSKIVYF